MAGISRTIISIVNCYTVSDGFTKRGPGARKIGAPLFSVLKQSDL